MTKDDIGKRCKFTNRNGRIEYGAVRDVLDVSATAQSIDLALDNHTRARFYVPNDMVELLPEDHPEWKEPLT
jgi:hypothetical protein